MQVHPQDPLGSRLGLVIVGATWKACRVLLCSDIPWPQGSLQRSLSLVALLMDSLEEKREIKKSDADTKNNFYFLPKGNEAQSGVQDFRGFQASRPLPTSLGYLVTQGHQGYLAWKVSGAHTSVRWNLWGHTWKDKYCVIPLL